MEKSNKALIINRYLDYALRASLDMTDFSVSPFESVDSELYLL